MTFDLSNFSVVSGLIGAMAPALVFISFVWVVLRTGSRHILFYRLWRLTHGSNDIADAEINAYVQNQTSLMYFRFFAGVQVRTLNGARELIRWTEECKVEMRTVRRCGAYFDLDLRLIKVAALPSALMQRIKLVAAIVMFLMAMMCCLGMTANSSLLQFKKSKQWFLLNSEGVRRFWFDDAIRESDCTMQPSVNAQRTGFRETDVELLCQMLLQRDATNFIEKTLFEQRGALIVFLISFLGMAWVPFSAFVSARTAYLLFRRNLNSVPSGGQLSLNWDKVEFSSGGDKGRAEVPIMVERGRA